jgi:hypothetical protein
MVDIDGQIEKEMFSFGKRTSNQINIDLYRCGIFLEITRISAFFHPEA